MLEAVWRDLTHGARLLVKNPGFSFVAVLSIAIGVGVNAAMFSMADALLLRPLQVPRASDVVAVSATTPQEGAGALRNRWLSYRDYVDPRDRARSFTSLGAFQVLVTSVATGATEPAQTWFGLAVSGNFFDTLGLQPALGRFFLPGEDRVAERNAVVVLAHDTWTGQFSSDPRILEPGPRMACNTGERSLGNTQKHRRVGFSTGAAVGPQRSRRRPGRALEAARIDEGYLKTMGIPMLNGRAFRSADAPDAPRVVIVNQTLAARHWPGQNPIGKRVRVGGPTAPWSEIVGVAADSKYMWIAEAPTPFLYVPRSQDAGVRSTFVAATDGQSAALAAPLRQIVRDIDPNLPIASIRTMEDFYQGSAVKGIVNLVRIVSGIGFMGMGLARARLSE